VGFADNYLSKQRGFKPWFTFRPSEKLSYIVVIPAFREPDLNTALDSLWHCTRPQGHVEVIIVLNLPENADATLKAYHQRLADETVKWTNLRSTGDFRFLVMHTFQMPVKDAGVGLARKRGMDEAVYRFNLNSDPHGIVLCFDADSSCDANYFTAIEETLFQNPATKGFNVYFEHPYFLPGTHQVNQGILMYEMHLRCLNLFTRFTGFPFAFHTIGSCFGVRATIYAQQGGMNKRKAGEDFYFLHKVIPLGNFEEINSTKVVPSPRESDRVPFGTGAAISKYLASGEDILTYAPQCFFQLQQFFQIVGSLYMQPKEELAHTIAMLPPPLHEYLHELEAAEAIHEINANCSSLASFKIRFFRWFDAFRVIKFLNYASIQCFDKISVTEAAIRILALTGNVVRTEISNEELLLLLRQIERSRVIHPQ